MYRTQRYSGKYYIAILHTIQHRKNLHLAFIIGIGNDVHVQVADIIQVLSDAFSVSGLPEHLPLPAYIESGGCLYAESGNGMRLSLSVLVYVMLRISPPTRKWLLLFQPYCA